MNIYDLAGNVYEFTLEYTSSTDIPCAIRGGVYVDSGSNTPASYRGLYGTAYSDDNIGFRASLFLNK